MTPAMDASMSRRRHRHEPFVGDRGAAESDVPKVDAPGDVAPGGRGPRPLDGRLVLLGVTGSIAAYKAAELVAR